MTDPQRTFDDLQAALRRAESHEEEEQLGRAVLAGLLHRQPRLLDAVLKQAKRDNRMRRCLSAARYYSGLSDDICARIDAVIQAPFPAARNGRRRR
jgi:hypothetical protein